MEVKLVPFDGCEKNLGLTCEFEFENVNLMSCVTYVILLVERISSSKNFMHVYN